MRLLSTFALRRPRRCMPAGLAAWPALAALAAWPTLAAAGPAGPALERAAMVVRAPERAVIDQADAHERRIADAVIEIGGADGLRREGGENGSTSALGHPASEDTPAPAPASRSTIAA